MNKIKYFLVIVLLVTFICGCGKKIVTDTNKVDTNKKEDVIEESVSNNESNSEQNILVENKNNNQLTNDTNAKPNINTSDKTNTGNNNSNNSNPINNNTTNQPKEENNIKKEEVKVEENIITTRKIVCTMTQSNENKGFNAIITATATFEDNDMIYFTMHWEKKYDEEYSAYDDDIIEDVTQERLDNLNDGRSGNIYIKDNTVFYTLNYDLKNYPDLKPMVTSHIEYDDYYNHMINNNGYTCTKIN